MVEIYCHHKLKFIERQFDINSNGKYDMYFFRCQKCWVTCKIHAVFVWPFWGARK